MNKQRNFGLDKRNKNVINQLCYKDETRITLYWHYATKSNIVKYTSNKIYLSESRRDGVVARASASQSVDLGFIPLVESYQKTLKNGIYSFPAWRSAFMGDCGEQAGKFAGCVLGQST